MDIHTISLCLGALGIIGIAALLTGVGLVVWHYRGSRMKQLSALACLFFLAMAASYGILHEVWGWLYVLGAFKAGTWWLRRVINQRI